MTSKQIAQDIVSRFFIGGSKDSLEQPNLTKEDLEYSIEHAINDITKERDQYKAGLEEIRESGCGRWNQSREIFFCTAKDCFGCVAHKTLQVKP